MTAERSPETLLPLSAVAFEILLTLADGDSHGYHIMQEVERRTSGAITLHPGTLYRALARLLEQDVIDELDGSGGAAFAPKAFGELGRACEGQAPRAVKTTAAAGPTG